MAFPMFKLQNSSVVPATSFATASTTPVSGRVYTAWVASQHATLTPNTPTCSGTNGYSGTWTEIANAVQDLTKITLFRSVATSASAGVLTFDFGGQTQAGAIWGVEEWQDVATTINVQSVTEAVDNGTTLTFSPALAAFASSTNGTYAVMAASGNLVAVRGSNAQGTMLQIPTAAGASSVINACPFYCAGATLAPTLTCGGAGSDLVAIAIEVGNTLTAGGGSLVGGSLVKS